MNEQEKFSNDTPEQKKMPEQHIQIKSKLEDIFENGSVDLTISKKCSDDLKKEMEEINQDDIKKALIEQASFIKERILGADYNLPNIKVKETSDENTVICCYVDENASDNPNDIDVFLYLAKQIETKEFGKLHFEIDDSYIEQHINFFKELEKTKNVTVLQNNSEIDHYALLKCGNYVIPVAKFLEIIDPGAEQFFDYSYASSRSDHSDHLQKILNDYNIDAEYDERDDLTD